jgi:hypothetical protein
MLPMITPFSRYLGQPQIVYSVGLAMQFGLCKKQGIKLF